MLTLEMRHAGDFIRGILPASGLYLFTPVFTDAFPLILEEYLFSHSNRGILADLRIFSVLSHDGLQLELLVTDPSWSTRGVFLVM
jgi:hypothetical protein